MTKQEQIKARLIKPIEVGDYLNITIPYTTQETVVTGRGKTKAYSQRTVEHEFSKDGTLLAIDGDLFTLGANSHSIPSELKGIISDLYIKNTQYDRTITVDRKYAKPTFYDCGAQPFAKEKHRISFFNQDISALLLKASYGRISNNYAEPEYKTFNGDTITYGGVNFNPFVTDAKGDKHYYQRGLIWDLRENQLLIESIYQGIEIGKFLFRYLAWGKLEKDAKSIGHGYSFDCVDGKQRFNAILTFIQNKFPDLNGNYWDDLAPRAQDRFLNYANLSYGELPESATDNDVLDNFLTLNHSGRPMSEEHIAFVRSINLK